MGNNNYFDELIVSYLSKNLNPEEEAFVLDWINSSEQNKQYFEELKGTWNLLLVKQTEKDLNADVEWDQFKQVISTKEKELYKPFGFDNEAAGAVKPAGKTEVFKFFISSAVAASILIVIVLGWKLVNNNTMLKKQLALNNKEISLPASFIKHQFNTTDKIKKLALEDGSEVILYGESELSYCEPFNGSKRDITLTGKAYFKVAKDKTRPFTVFSGDISTTALGTQFTVTALPHEKHILVRLHEGKVVVKSVKPVGRHHMNDVYLVPGQELLYDVTRGTAKVRSYLTAVKLNKRNLKKEGLPNDNPLLPQYKNKSWFMFNNQPLDDIFNALSDMYNVKISYPKKDISKMYFIGTFNKSDSLEYILEQIATINNLSVSKDTTVFIIKKRDSKEKN